MKDNLTDIIWKLFEKTGKINYYILSKRIQEDSEKKK